MELRYSWVSSVYGHFWGSTQFYLFPLAVICSIFFLPSRGCLLFPLTYFYSDAFFLSFPSRLMYGFTVYLAIVYAWCMSILAGIIIIFPFGKFDWWLMESLNHLHYKASKGRQRATTTAAAAITQIYPGGTRTKKSTLHTVVHSFCCFAIIVPLCLSLDPFILDLMCSFFLFSVNN